MFPSHGTLYVLQAFRAMENCSKHHNSVEKCATAQKNQM
uniref:Uncharacterized protein n=1 Tax=Rhizophora mucronata TaxID=61149 RepID=A0A2P2KZE3_RHIMU